MESHGSASQQHPAQQVCVVWTGGLEQEVPRQQAFTWSKHWYPVCLEANLSREAPNKVTLLVSELFEC
jgi:hypothetical protein